MDVKNALLILAAFIGAFIYGRSDLQARREDPERPLIWLPILVIGGAVIGAFAFAIIFMIIIDF